MTTINSTIEKFGYPSNLVKNYENWVVILRPVQITLGSLILACKQEVESFSLISRESHLELADVIIDIEKTLKTCFNYEKINYLMLMMVDPHVHFHIIPRYKSTRRLAENVFEDFDWPGPPNLLHKRKIDDSVYKAIQKEVIQKWGG